MIESSTSLIAVDVHDVVLRTRHLWEGLRHQRIFLTGGTGFFGCWFLETFIYANEYLALNASLMVLTRNKSLFLKKYPFFATQSCLLFHEGDVRTFEFPSGVFSYVVHAAAIVATMVDKSVAQDIIVAGTKRVLAFAKQCMAEHVLYVSSGAVYGVQSPGLYGVSEQQVCAPDEHSAYAMGKYHAEQCCALSALQEGLNIKIARCFSFVGPYLSLDGRFAIGNFIRNGLNDQGIVIHGDGTPYRSYLYAGDLMVFLWSILFQGKANHPYNVGSPKAYSIAEIAAMVARCFNKDLSIKMLKSPQTHALLERYVPDVARVHQELGLVARTDLMTAIHKTVQWHLAQKDC